MNTQDESRVQLIPVDRIRVLNPRARDRKKFESIVESIATVGLKKPITVTVRTDASESTAPSFDLVCGQGRLEAFVALGQKEIPALVRGLSNSESLLASLAENIARRRVRALDQIETIQWMQGQGHTCDDIAQKTGLGSEYIKHILSLLRSGEERLLDAVLHGRIPISVAVRISAGTDEETQRLLVEAYESKAMTQKTVRAFKQIIDQRRQLGRAYGKRMKTGRRTNAESLVAAYKQETQRQKILIKKARLCEVKLLSVSAAFRLLLGDEDYLNLLRAEKLETMPKFIAERARAAAA